MKTPPSYWCLLPLALASLVGAAEPEPLPWHEGSTTVVLLPDTQQYTKSRPAYFEAQTQWIAANQAARRIACVLHMGDITEHNAPAEWEIAQRAFGLLDGKVPYLLIPGNHDYAAGGRETLLTRYFPVEKVKQQPTFGGLYEEGKADNSYQLLTLNGQPWLALGLELAPRAKVIEWADGVLRKYADRSAIVSTHAYLFRDNTRFDHTKGAQRANPAGWAGDGADGEELWQQLLRRHANVQLVVCGHVRTGGLAYLASLGDHGNTVHQILNDYEAMRGTGAGFMRLLEFLPDGQSVQVKAWSPVRQQYLTDPANQFTLQLRPAPSPAAVSPAPAPAAPATAEQAQRLEKGAWNKVETRTLADLPDFRPGPVALCRYGGLASAPKLGATGYFRAERVGEQWTLVDPDGCPFISVGLCSTNLSLFAEAAVKDKFGTPALWAERTATLLRESGFNTLGRWSDAELFRKSPAPLAYTSTLSFMASYDKQRPKTNGASHYPERTIPVFDPEWPAFCDRYAQVLAATKDDPWLLGHFSDNELPFRPTALSCYLALPATDPGRRAADQWLAEHHKRADKLTEEDQLAFLAVVADRYYATVARAIKQVDPHHLYIGSRLNGRNINDGTFRGSRAVDVVTINMYHQWSLNDELIDRCATLSGHPVLNSEWYAMSLASDKVNTNGAGFRVRTQHDRGLFYQNLCLGMLGNPNMVGWHWFKYGGDAADSSRGLVSPALTPHADLLDLMRQLNTQAYPLRTLLRAQARPTTPARAGLQGAEP